MNRQIAKQAITPRSIETHYGGVKSTYIQDKYAFNNQSEIVCNKFDCPQAHQAPRPGPGDGLCNMILATCFSHRFRAAFAKSKGP